MRRKRTPLGIAIAFIAALIAGYLTVQQKGGVPVAQPQQSKAGAATHHVAYVSDGDTIKLDSGEHVRLIGIDTPESHDNPKLAKDVLKRKSSRKAQLAMGLKAAAYTRSLLANQDVRLEFDVGQRDRYQRLLAYVYLTDGTFVNEKIIREGYAYPLTIPPNVRYADKFKQWFDEARMEKRGLWGR